MSTDSSSVHDFTVLAAITPAAGAILSMLLRFHDRAVHFETAGRFALHIRRDGLLIEAPADAREAAVSLRALLDHMSAADVAEAAHLPVSLVAAFAAGFAN